MKAWRVKTSGAVIALELHQICGPDRSLSDIAKELIEAKRVELVLVKWDDRECFMAVDKDGETKSLLVNQVATRAFWLTCDESVNRVIVGDAVIFKQGGTL